MARSDLLSTFVTAPSLRARAKQVRRSVGASMAAGFFERAATLGRLAKQARPDHHGLAFTGDVPYLDSGLAEHTLDVYAPADADGTNPVVLYVHGGAFASLSKDTHWLMGLVFARRGFVTLVPNYRLSPRHRFPAHLEDVAEAWRFAVQHAGRFGGDAKRAFVLAGESAGANLIAAMALGQAYEIDEPYIRLVDKLGVTPTAVLAACGVFEVQNGKRFSEMHPGLHWFFDDRYRELEDNYPPQRGGKAVQHDLINPLTLVEQRAPRRPLPPFFLPVGDRDHLIDDHRRMERALQSRGGTAELAVYPGGIHAFHAFVFDKEARRCWADHFAFLAKLGVPVRERR